MAAQTWPRFRLNRCQSLCAFNYDHMHKYMPYLSIHIYYPYLLYLLPPPPTHLAAVDEFHRRLAKEEIDEISLRE